MRSKYKRTEKYDPVAIERKNRAHLVKGLVAVAMTEYWYGDNDDVAKRVRAMDDMRFANMDIGDVDKDGIVVQGHLVSPENVIWSVLYSYHINEDMDFDDVLYLDHVIGRNN